MQAVRHARWRGGARVTVGLEVVRPNAPKSNSSIVVEKSFKKTKEAHVAFLPRCARAAARRRAGGKGGYDETALFSTIFRG